MIPEEIPVKNEKDANLLRLEGMLRAHITVLLKKCYVSYQTPVNEVQRLLLERYDVEYKLEDIVDEMICMRYEEYEADKHVTMHMYYG